VRRALGHGWLPAFDRRIDHRMPQAAGLRLDLGHVNAVAVDGDVVLVGLGLVRPPLSLAWHVLRERGLRVAARLGLGRSAQWLVGRWRGLSFVSPKSLDLWPAPGQIRMEDTGLRPGWSSVVVELQRPLGRSRSRIVSRLAGRGVPMHNVLPYGAGLVVADSGGGRLLLVDRQTGAVTRSVALEGELPFPRGVLHLGGDRFVVGTQRPAALNVVDLDAERVDDRFVLPDDRAEAPFALVAVPDRFSDPSGRLPAARADWAVPGADTSAGGARAVASTGR
jgi:hypothetical protein